MPWSCRLPPLARARQVEVDRGPVAAGQVLADHDPAEPLRVADVVEATELAVELPQPPSSPIQSVQRWINQVSRIRP